MKVFLKSVRKLFLTTIYVEKEVVVLYPLTLPCVGQPTRTTHSVYALGADTAYSRRMLRDWLRVRRGNGSGERAVYSEPVTDRLATRGQREAEEAG